MRSARSTPRYALFVAIPAVGHINPLLRQAEELMRRGWRVGLASTSELRAHVEAGTVPFLDLGPSPISADAAVEAAADVTASTAFLRGSMRLLRHVGRHWPAIYDGLLAAIATDRPDVMVVDLITSAGFDAAETAGVPYLVNNADLLAVISLALLPSAPPVPLLFSGRSVAAPRRVDRLLGLLLGRLAGVVARRTFGAEMNALRASRGLPPVDPLRRLAGRMIMVDSAFGLEYARPLPPLIQLVGPMLEPDPPPLPPELSRWVEDGPPVALANLGTIARPAPDLLARLARGLTADDFRTLWITRDDPPPARSPGLRIEPWVPSQLGALLHPNVRAFVSHCGINSAHESLQAGVPLVGLPLFADQRDMAQRAVDAGVGLMLDKATFTPEQLRAAVRRAIADPALRRNIPAIQSSFRLAGGAGRAADLIEQAAAVGVDHYRVGWHGAGDV